MTHSRRSAAGQTPGDRGGVNGPQLNAGSHGPGAALHASAVSCPGDRRPASARYSSCAGAVSVATGRPVPTVHSEPPVVRRRRAGSPRPATEPENPRPRTSKVGAQPPGSAGGGPPGGARGVRPWGEAALTLL